MAVKINNVLKKFVYNLDFNEKKFTFPYKNYGKAETMMLY